MAIRCIVHISSLPPTACGVAEYTAALTKHIYLEEQSIENYFVQLDGAINASEANPCRIAVDFSDRNEVARAIRFISRLDRPIISLQHEFKLYGGADGENIVEFLSALKDPVVSTLHTICPSFPHVRQRIFDEIIYRSRVVVVFSERARRILAENHRADLSKVRVIPHGVPFVTFRLPEEVAWDRFEKREVRFISLGLLRSAKGFELAIAAFNELRASFTEFRYIICGGNHPKNPAATEYRKQLIGLVREYGLENHVVFVNRYLSESELIDAIQSCDVGVTPYTRSEQSSSGVLALFLGCGRPVVSTEFQYAKAIVNADNGFLVPMGDSRALAAAIKCLAEDAKLRGRMNIENYRRTRDWVWPLVAREFIKILNELGRCRPFRE